MAKTYRVSRNGQIKMTATFIERADGTLWHDGKNPMPLLDSEAVGFLTTGKDKIIALVKAGKYDEIPSDCFARVGVSASGLEVKSYDDIRAEAIAAMTPAQIERNRIAGLYAQAARRRDADDDNNEIDYYRIKGQADAALKAWRETYPQEAANEEADRLESEADHNDELASGALVFDMDGSLTAADQQRRHDEFEAKAAELRNRAAELRRK